MKFNKIIQDLIPTMKKWRQTIHSFPEIAYEEYKTAEFIEKKLKEFGIKVIKNIGKTCLLYTSPSPRDLTASRMPSSA